MKTLQKGFTLIELMIVIAIIAILAAIAIPTYQNYIVRTQVSEGLSLAASAKTGVSEFVSSRGHWPKGNASAGIASATSITGSYVDSVTVGDGNGLITISYNKDSPQKANPKIDGDTLVLSASTNAGAIVWACKAGATNPVANKYLPSTCR